MSPNPPLRELSWEEDAPPTDLLLDARTDAPNTKNEPQVDSKLLLKIYVIVFALNLGFQVLNPAQTQIYESIYCAQWYDKHPVAGLPTDGTSIPESFCKIAPVQTQISTLKGWLESFGAAPGLILSIPMGILADRWGRRSLIILNLTVVFLTQAWTTFVTWFDGQMPLRAIWIGAGLNVFSGGLIVTELLYVCVLTDISPSDRVAETFFRTTAFGQFGKVFGPFIAAGLMRVDPWLAIWFGLSFLVITVVLATTVPETLHWRTSNKSGSVEVSQDQAEPTPNRASSPEALQQLLKIWSDWRLAFVALTSPFRLTCYALSDLLQRYVSDRYGWTLADATLVYSLQAVGAGLVLFILLPLVSVQIERRFAFSIIQKNVVLSRASLLIMAISYAVIGLAPNVIMMIIGLLIETLSTGFGATLKAIAAALVNENDRGRVFSVLAIAETCSHMMAYPTTAALFNVGIEKGGGIWLGLPYDVVSVLAVFGFLIMCLARFERPVRLL